MKNRFTARESMIEEHGAGKPYAGICAGVPVNRCLYCDEFFVFGMSKVLPFQ